MTDINNVCASCGTLQEGALKFIFGAKSDNPQSKDDWCLVEGTGRLVCALCYPEESRSGKNMIESYIARFNARAKAESA